MNAACIRAQLLYMHEVSEIHIDVEAIIVFWMREYFGGGGGTKVHNWENIRFTNTLQHESLVTTTNPFWHSSF